MFFCTPYSDIVLAVDHEPQSFLAPFCLLPNTPDWGKIGVTRPSALFELFA
jgi:hypothetical protein